MNFLKKVTSNWEKQSAAHHESGVSAKKTLDSLMYHMMREDAKKWALVKTIEDYVAEQNISNDYMVKFAKKLMWFTNALLQKYGAGDEQIKEVVKEDEDKES